ncbi:hypothetical protein Hanom_Chr08g00687131 [Helianthus anomalus]
MNSKMRLGYNVMGLEPPNILFLGRSSTLLLPLTSYDHPCDVCACGSSNQTQRRVRDANQHFACQVDGPVYCVVC